MPTVDRNHWIGAGVRYARTLRGMLVKDVAAAIGRSDAYVSRIEKGDRPATPGDLMAFAHVLEVELQWLLNPPLPDGIALDETQTDSVGASGPYDGSGNLPLITSAAA